MQELLVTINFDFLKTYLQPIIFLMKRYCGGIEKLLCSRVCARALR